MKLKDICIGITDGSHNPPQGGEISDYYMISSKNIFDNRITMDEPRYLSEEQFLSENKRTNIVPGDVLVTIVGTVGRAAVVNKDIGKITLQRSVAVLHPKKDICDSRYLMYALQSKRAYFEKEAHGVAQKGLYLKQLSDIDIVVPAIDKQAITVDLLDRVNGIIKYRQNQIEALDNLIKARFVELFGLPVSNSKEWPTELMSDVAPAVNYTGEFDDEVWLLNLDMVEAQTGKILGYLMVTVDEIGNSTCTFDESNVLYSKLRPYLNKVVIPDRCGYATSELVPLQPVKSKLNREYLAFMLRSDEFVKMITEKVAGAKMPRVSMGDFRKFAVPIPPLDLQNQFSEFVKKVDKSKVVGIGVLIHHKIFSRRYAYGN